MSSRYFLWLALCLGAAAAGLALRRRYPRPGLALAFLGLIGGAVSVGWQVSSLFSSGSGRSVDRYDATVAYFMGYELLNELGSRAGHVAVLLPAQTRSNRDRLDVLFDTLARVLAPFPGLRLHDASFQASERRIVDGALTAEDFTEPLAHITNALAWVSFVGLPKDPASFAPLADSDSPPWFVFDPSGATAWRASLKRGAIRRVIAPRPDAAPGDATGPPDELFREYFVMATPANADAVADRIERARLTASNPE